MISVLVFGSIAYIVERKKERKKEIIMKCQKCSSSQTKTLLRIVTEGTETSVSDQHGIEGAGFVSTRTKTVTMNIDAQQYAFKPKFTGDGPWWYNFMMGILGVISIVFGFIAHGPYGLGNIGLTDWWWSVGAGFVLFSILISFFKTDKIERDWAEKKSAELDEYNRTWKCLDCGEVWVKQ